MLLSHRVALIDWRLDLDQTLLVERNWDEVISRKVGRLWVVYGRLNGVL